MQYRHYPQTSVRVSEVGFGLWTISTGWWGEVDDTEAISMLHEAYDLGITLFDAADTYGEGRSEEQLGKAFEGRRDKVVYATKFGYNFYDYSNERRGQQELPQDFSPKFVRFALEQSLRRLQTEYIDIYQIHNLRQAQVDDDTLFALLEDLKNEGKIRTYGIALGPANGWLYEGINAIEHRNVTSLQMIWNIFEQHPGQALVDAANRCNAATGFLVRVPHASGMLEGRYTAETTFPKNDHRRHRPKSWLTHGLAKVERLRFLERENRTMAQAAIQWLLSESRVVSVLPNIYDREGLREFASASETPRLTPEEHARIAELAKTNFGEPDEEEPIYKGTMHREAEALPS